jgi:branched-subunit amino acid transport protein
MDISTSLFAWMALFTAIAGTMVWRVAGVFLASRIPPDSTLMVWINNMAYAMVSGVVMLALVRPTGVLETTALEHRLFGLAVGLALVFFTKRLMLSLLFAVAGFAVAVTFF